MSGRERLALSAMAAGLLALLVLAAWLKPDVRRMGTHQQFGLPPCSFTVLFGRRCPTCGMTTAWAHVVRGQAVGALRANVGGALLAMASVIAVPWLLGLAWRGRWPARMPGSMATACVAVGWLVVVMVEWGVRLLAP